MSRIVYMGGEYVPLHTISTIRGVGGKLRVWREGMEVLTITESQLDIAMRGPVMPNNNPDLEVWCAWPGNTPDGIWFEIHPVIGWEEQSGEMCPVIAFMGFADADDPVQLLHDRSRGTWYWPDMGFHGTASAAMDLIYKEIERRVQSRLTMVNATNDKTAH